MGTNWKLGITSALALVSALVACASDEGAPPSTATPVEQQSSVADGSAPSPDAASQCPFPMPFDAGADASCPAACAPIYGNELSPTEGCTAHRLVGCITCLGGCGGAPEGWCVKSLSDGTIFDEVASYTLPALDPSLWGACTQADSDKMNAAMCF